MTIAPALPRFLTQAASLLPLLPLHLAARQVAAATIGRHRSLQDRLAGHAGKRIAIEPSDLPVVFIVELGDGGPRIEVVRSARGCPVSAHIRGHILALIDLVEGRVDGDALFFSRDLAIEGDVEAIVAIRNALDAEDIDLIREASAQFGPLAAIADGAARRALGLLRELCAANERRSAS